MTTFDWSKLKVLVVEDETDLRETLVLLFKRKKAKVFSAGDGLEAQEILRQNEVDLILSDVKMPRCDGVELLKEVRAKNPEIPVVFLATGFADIDPEQAKARGAAGLINKPFSISQLFESLESALLKTLPIFKDAG